MKLGINFDAVEQPQVVEHLRLGSLVKIHGTDDLTFTIGAVSALSQQGDVVYAVLEVEAFDHDRVAQVGGGGVPGVGDR